MRERVYNSEAASVQTGGFRKPPELSYEEDRVLQHADPVHLHADSVAGLQPDLRLHPEPNPGWRAGGDAVAGLQRQLLGQKRDDGRHVKDQVVGVAVLAKLAVDPGPDAQVGRVRELINQRDGRAERRRSVEVLAENDPAILAKLEIAGTDVVH